MMQNRCLGCNIYNFLLISIVYLRSEKGSKSPKEFEMKTAAKSPKPYKYCSTSGSRVFTEDEKENYDSSGSDEPLSYCLKVQFTGNSKELRDSISMSASQRDSLALALSFTICQYVNGPLVLLDEADSHMKQPGMLRLKKMRPQAAKF